MKERELCNVLGKTINTDGFEYVNIPDSAGMIEMPYDGVLNYQGSYISIEAKRMTDYKAFNPKMLRDSQIRGLTHTTATHGTALVVLFIWKARTYNRMFYWEWRDFLRITENLTKSIPKKVLEQQEYCECKKKRFELEKFYKFLDHHTVL